MYKRSFPKLYLRCNIFKLMTVFSIYRLNILRLKYNNWGVQVYKKVGLIHPYLKNRFLRFFKEIIFKLTKMLDNSKTERELLYKYKKNNFEK